MSKSKPCGPPKGVELSEARFLYVQRPDTDQPEGALAQEISIEAVDGGGGFFLILKTERWAVDSWAEMAGLLRDVERRLTERGKA